MAFNNNYDFVVVHSTNELDPEDFKYKYTVPESERFIGNIYIVTSDILDKKQREFDLNKITSMKTLEEKETKEVTDEINKILELVPSLSRSPSPISSTSGTWSPSPSRSSSRSRTPRAHSPTQSPSPPPIVRGPPISRSRSPPRRRVSSSPPIQRSRVIRNNRGGSRIQKRKSRKTRKGRKSRKTLKRRT